MRKKIVLIGAGSAMFTQGLAIDLMERPCGFKWHLSLVDIDEQALDSVAKLVRKMLDAKEADVELTYSTDRRDELPGADYVVATVGVGGRRAWEQDVFIPRRYGVNQPVGDTAMPGGISRAMRMIPAMLDIAADVRRLCPDAHFFNYSNPMTAICRALRKTSDVPVIGLCHGVHNTAGYLARFAGVDRGSLSYRAAGVNHLTFLYDIRSGGEDLRPRLSERLAEVRAAGKRLDEPFAWELFEDFGAFPAPGDRHITEFMAERFPGGRYYGKTLGFDAFSFEGTIEYGDRIYDEMTRLGQSPDPLPGDFFDRVSGEHEQLMEIIDSIEHDGREHFSMNLPNGGAVPGLPRDAIVEMTCAAAADGMKPAAHGDFSDALAAIILRSLAITEMTVEAALTGNRRFMEEAVLMGGYLADPAAAAKMTDELIAAQKRYLPQFA